MVSPRLNAQKAHYQWSKNFPKKIWPTDTYLLGHLTGNINILNLFGPYTGIHVDVVSWFVQISAYLLVELLPWANDTENRDNTKIRLLKSFTASEKNLSRPRGVARRRRRNLSVEWRRIWYYAQYIAARTSPTDLHHMLQ